MTIYKKRTAILFAAVLLLICSISVCAEGAYSTAFYRAFDNTEGLSAAERNKLDGQFIEFMEQYQLDLGMASVTENSMGDRTLEAFGPWFFTRSELGYGENKDGIAAVYMADKGTLSLFFFGDARDRVSEEYQSYIEGYAPSFREKYGIHGVMYSTLALLKKGLDGDDAKIQAIRSAESGIEADILESETFTMGGVPRWGEESSDHPFWYPKDIQDFPFYSDPDAPRILDLADIFSDEAEKAMAEQISVIGQKYGKDIVVITDMSTYGMTIEQYAADFYDYCGYGYTQQREGICLMLCMDPANRGGWTCATGDECIKLLSPHNANRLDDVLYSYLGNEEFETGVADWIENVGRMFNTGLAIAPDWYPANGISDKDYFSDSAPRVVDDCAQLTQEQYNQLCALADTIRKEYGLDAAIHIADDLLGMSEEHYNAFYFSSMGYGVGNRRSGVLLTLFLNDGRRPLVNVYGDAEQKVSQSQAKQIRDCMRWGTDSFDKVSDGLNGLEHLLKKGWVPKTPGFWILAVLLGGGCVFVVSLIREIRSDSFHSGSGGKGRRHTTRYRTRSHYSSGYSGYSSGSSSSRSSGSSSGRSSYSSGSSGSSGSSHSGSGRKF